jgi:hypothetical protein
MKPEPRVSAWTRRAALIAASLAAVATSRARWTVHATLPSPLPADPAKGTRIVVEASHEPSVEVRLAGRTEQILLHPEEKAGWLGSGTFYVPPGYELANASISGVCDGGMCSPCVAPATAFVKVAKQEAVRAWSLSASSAEQTTPLDVQAGEVWRRVRVSASDLAQLEVLPAGDPAGFPPARIVRVWDNGSAFRVIWDARPPEPDASLTVRWIARATIYGFCPGEGECKPPATAHVSIDFAK